MSRTPGTAPGMINLTQLSVCGRLDGFQPSQGMNFSILLRIAFLNAFSYHPDIIGFASLGCKDTLCNIERTGEFVWNLATRSLAEAMNACCAEVDSSISEFSLSGVTPKILKACRSPSGDLESRCIRVQD